jgi:uncharacterized membrane protein
MIPFTRDVKRDIALVCAFLVLSAGLFLLPTGFEQRIAKRSLRCRGEVIGVENSGVQQFGMIKSGDQSVTLKLLEGKFKDRIVQANNPLLGHMNLDKLFFVGDTVLVVLSLDEQGEIIFANPQDHYRIGFEFALLLLFALALLLFGGWTGIKALLSFVFAGLMLWKILVPGLLKGYDPLLLALATVALLTAVIIFLVAGLTRKGLVAFCGAFLGVATSCVLAVYFTGKLHVHGAVMPFAETLLYSGYGHLDLSHIFIAAVFLAASGAVMDLAMDVAASMNELAVKNQEIGRLELIRSGVRVGRAVVGTMTTTLLLAYSGGYITLLMAFMAQGVPLVNLFNLIYVAAEVLKTLVGSFGLVMVAPFTAVMGGMLLTGNRRLPHRQEARSQSAVGRQILQESSTQIPL